MKLSKNKYFSSVFKSWEVLLLASECQKSKLFISLSIHHSLTNNVRYKSHFYLKHSQELSQKIASEPALREAEGDDHEDAVEDEHDAAHHLGHLPLEGQDGDEDDQQHREQHRDVAAHPGRVHVDGLLVDSAEDEPGQRQTHRHVEQV